MYLAGLDEVLGHLLIQLIEDHADPAIQVHLLVLAEEQTSVIALLNDVQELQQVPSATERDALTKARLGQGLFRQRVAEQEPICRVTGLARQEFLIASHIKPWRECDHQERLDGANGLLLSPHVDKLFDRHWISFDRDGQLIWQHEAAGDALRCWGDYVSQCDSAFFKTAGAVFRFASGMFAVTLKISGGQDSLGGKATSVPARCILMLGGIQVRKTLVKCI